MRSSFNKRIMQEGGNSGYFDYNATTPMVAVARESYFRALESHWYNPSGLYPAAGQTKRLLEEARGALAGHLGIADEERIVFTSGATEANNLVLGHLAISHPQSHILVSAVEHPSLREPARQSFGYRSHTIPVDASGVVDLGSLEERLAENQVGLVSIMAANNETGVLQPWKEAQRLCHKYEVPFHCDATQWIGKLEATGLGSCDWLSGSAHKFGGPKGVGFLVVPENLKVLNGAQTGGPQENGLRAGTENYPAVAAMIAALDYANQQLERVKALAEDRDAFEEELTRILPGVVFGGANSPRLWNTSMVVVPRFNNLKWLTRLAQLGFELSTGSACSSGKGNPSHVMEAMGLDFDQMSRVLRISAGWQTSREDWLALAQGISQVYQDLKVASRMRAGKPSISLTDINPLH
ncbi:MAG: cysteine desulfurase [Verrucomicrobiae bacterium]|nr:cysteine desulfurase [Verrucomicrobiae bacterium]